jgi:hypothetical protein
LEGAGSAASLKKDWPAQKPSQTASRDRMKTQCSSIGYLSGQKRYETVEKVSEMPISLRDTIRKLLILRSR